MKVEEDNAIDAGRNPWVAQWAEHISRLCIAHEVECPVYEILARVGDHAFFEADHMGWIMLYDPSWVKSKVEWDGRSVEGDATEERPELLRCDFVDDAGEQCQYIGTRQQVHSPQKAHGWCTLERSLVFTNQCPCCRFVGVKKSIRKHVKTLFTKGVCPLAERNQHEPYKQDAVTLQSVEEATCPLCQEVLKGHETIQRHIADHISEWHPEAKRRDKYFTIRDATERPVQEPEKYHIATSSDEEQESFLLTTIVRLYTS